MNRYKLEVKGCAVDATAVITIEFRAPNGDHANVLGNLMANSMGLVGTHTVTAADQPKLNSYVCIADSETYLVVAADLEAAKATLIERRENNNLPPLRLAPELVFIPTHRPGAYSMASEKTNG
jgi:hypothetical protein